MSEGAKVQIRCSAKERRQWEQLAATGNRTLSSWIRITLNQVAKAEAVASHEQESPE